MPSVAYFVYCKTVQMLPNETEAAIVGPILMLTPKFLPSEFSFAFAAGVMDVDFTRDNTVKILFKSPKDEVLMEGREVPLEPPQELTVQQTKLFGFQMAMDMKNVILSEEGIHKTEIYLNGELISSQPISVVKHTDAE